MNHSLLWRVLVLAGCLCCFQSVQADDDMPTNTTPATNYLGASLGTASSEFCTGLNNCGETSNTWKAYSGVRMSDKIFIEAAYVKFGEQQGLDGSTKISSNAKGYSTAGVVTYPLNAQIELFGKAGMWWWESEQKSTAGTQATDGSDILLGVGANYNLGDNMGVRAEWERYQRSQGSAAKQALDLLSVGVTFSSL
ncbi:outer membrane beta-barrel protein [Thiothrix eikelboomii]|uniref:outer membrane beta-barrel protein n=1 Tax=Thiothrix eikelboomii TaxID=92487 RepID=UPI003BB200C2